VVLHTVLCAFEFNLGIGTAIEHYATLLLLSLTCILARWPEQRWQMLERLKFRNVRKRSAHTHDRTTGTDRLPKVQMNNQSLPRYGRISAKELFQKRVDNESATILECIS
jgi:hypothetical protein